MVEKICVVGVWKTRTVACPIVSYPPFSLYVNDKRVLNVLASLHPLSHESHDIDDVSARYESLVSISDASSVGSSSCLSFPRARFRVQVFGIFP